MRRDAEFYIQKYQLCVHPEGGYYREIYRSGDQVMPVDQERYREGDEGAQNNILRSATTSIYFLLDKVNYSAWHVLKSDEYWNFCDGNVLKIHCITSDGKLTTHILGRDDENAVFQMVIKAGTWFAAELIDKTSFALVTCTVSPGFDFKDFKLANKEELSAKFPEHTAIITRLCVADKSEQKNSTTAGVFRTVSPLLLSDKDGCCALLTK